MSGIRPGNIPLSGRRILVTRARDQGAAFVSLLRKQGAEVLQLPMIRFQPPESWDAVDRAIGRLDCFSIILFTSVNGVEAFCRRLAKRRGDPRQLRRATLAAIGPRTAEALSRKGLVVDLLPGSYLAEGLVKALENRKLDGKEILLPRALEARDLLRVELEKRGARVTVVPVYRTVCAEESRGPLVAALETRQVDMVTFTASSTVMHFSDLLGPKRVAGLLRGVKVACIGPITAEAARTRGICVDLVPERFTIPDLAQAIVRYFS